MITKEELQEWRDSHVGKNFFTNLKDWQERVRKELVEGEYPTIERAGMEQLRLSTIVNILESIINIEIE